MRLSFPLALCVTRMALLTPERTASEVNRATGSAVEAIEEGEEEGIEEEGIEEGTEEEGIEEEGIEEEGIVVTVVTVVLDASTVVTVVVSRPKARNTVSSLGFGV